MDKGTLAHTSWNCKYHIVFAPKYRRQIVYGRYKVEIGKIIRTLCERKGIETIEAELCPDHLHMLVSIPPKYSVSEVMGYLKGKELIDDLRSVCESEISLWKSSFLVPRLLCGYRGEESKANSGVYKDAAVGG